MKHWAQGGRGLLRATGLLASCVLSLCRRKAVPVPDDVVTALPTTKLSSILLLNVKFILLGEILILYVFDGFHHVMHRFSPLHLLNATE